MSSRKSSIRNIFASILLQICSSFAVAQTAVPGEWLVQFRPNKRAHIKSFLKNQAFSSHQVSDRIMLVKANSPASFLKLDGIERVEPNYLYQITKTPNDTMYSGLWGLRNLGQADAAGILGRQGVDLNAEMAWEISTGSKKVVVAVIDTGVDFKIPDLKENAWINPIEAAGVAQVDDDKNGYVDDIHGFNFVSNTGDPTDDNGHGSHCSGTIGTRGNDKYGVVGLNWEVSIMAIKFISNDGTGTLENAVKAIDYARKNGAQIMRNTWGGTSESLILKQAISEANDAGILFVAAAGNNGADNDKVGFYPAGYAVDNIISVAAINNRARLANFSNFGLNKVHISAPGENILSTTPSGFENLSGTSMAAPHVTGVAALLMASEPTLGFREVRDRILANTRPLFRLKHRVSSGGMIDAFAVLSNTKPGLDLTDPALLGGHQASQISTEHPYANSKEEVFKVSIPGAKRIAIHFAKFETEANFDFVEIQNGAGKTLDKLSGYHSDEYTETIDGDTIVLRLTSDRSVNIYGFDVDEVFFEY